MAVGAQQPQVLAPVVAPVSVDVIDLQRHRIVEPLRAGPALGAFFWYANFAKRSTKQCRSGATPTTVLDEQVLRLL